ncbi:Ig-like domain-containing protein [Latilactobacillus sakei]|uniref:Ig-like domain-containing protein n=1 Tax=Latilactobacillus sakei TaxID=1599 RepID=UPI0025B5964A|nr:Ig-like domain-containing protein [Latilactobacillus sakei]MDN4009740.1 Ig-like domain-containing protein [Latilactobacillus sakei]
MIKSTKMVSVLLASSTVLGLMVSTGVATVRAAETGSAKTEQKVDTKALPKIADSKIGVDILTKGSTTFEGSNMLQGVHLSNDFSLTSGTLQILYTGTTLLSLNWGEKTKTQIAMPAEIKALMNKTTADGKTFLDYIEPSSYFYAANNAGGATKHTYERSDISYDKERNVLVFQNQVGLNNIFTGATLEAHIFVDLGQAITDLGERIPDAYNNSNYQFASSVTSMEAIPDWNILGNAESAGTIDWDKLDKGWTIVNQVPTIHEPVKDTDTKVIGGNAPAGSTVKIRANSEDSEVIGTAIAGPDGTYIADIPKQKAGTKLYADQTTALGTKGFGTAVVEHDNARPEAPKVESKKVTFGKPIKGTVGTPGNTIKAVDSVTGEEYAVVISPDGLSFTIDTNQMDEDSQPIIVDITEHNGDQVSEKTTVVVYSLGK